MNDILTNDDVQIAYGPIGPERMKRGPDGNLAPVRMLRGGYIMRGKSQTVMLLGCGIKDESVAFENIGHLNVTKVIGFIKDGTFQPPVVESVTVPISPDLLEAVRHHGLDESVIARMSPERIEDPVIILRFGFDHHVIDGRHRIERRRRDGRTDLRAHVVDGAVTTMFRIYVYTQAGDLWLRVREDTAALNAACFADQKSLTN